jgi:hypothetical protein
MGRRGTLVVAQAGDFDAFYRAHYRAVANVSEPTSEFSSLITCRGRLEAPGAIRPEFDPGPVPPPPSARP